MSLSYDMYFEKKRTQFDVFTNPLQPKRPSTHFMMSAKCGSAIE
jgi:hypothetical protein